eukprot:scaffold4030_cov33-Tisochrysis_lutea.AAC.1
MMIREDCHAQSCTSCTPDESGCAPVHMRESDQSPVPPAHTAYPLPGVAAMARSCSMESNSWPPRFGRDDAEPTRGRHGRRKTRSSCLSSLCFPSFTLEGGCSFVPFVPFVRPVRSIPRPLTKLEGRAEKRRESREKGRGLLACS